ncbi:response regulator transcription factor [Corallococcus soli]
MKEHSHWLRPEWLRLLTERELEVADGLHKGASNKEIAGKGSVETVKVHVKSIFAKTGTHSRAEFVARGRRS